MLKTLSTSLVSNICINLGDEKYDYLCIEGSEKIHNQESFDFWLSKANGKKDLRIIKSDKYLTLDFSLASSALYFESINGTEFGTKLRLTNENEKSRFVVEHLSINNCSVLSEIKEISIFKSEFFNTSFVKNITIITKEVSLDGYAFNNTKFLIKNSTNIDFSVPALMKKTFFFQKDCIVNISNITFDLDILFVGNNVQLWSKNRKHCFIFEPENSIYMFLNINQPNLAVFVFNKFVSYTLSLFHLTINDYGSTVFNFLPAIWKNCIIGEININIKNEAKFILDSSYIPVNIYCNEESKADFFLTMKKTKFLGKFSPGKTVNVYGIADGIAEFADINSSHITEFNTELFIIVKNIDVNYDASMNITAPTLTILGSINLYGILDVKGLFVMTDYVYIVFTNSDTVRLTCDFIGTRDINIFLENRGNQIKRSLLEFNYTVFVCKTPFSGEMNYMCFPAKRTYESLVFAFNFNKTSTGNATNLIYNVKLTQKKSSIVAKCIIPSINYSSQCDPKKHEIIAMDQPFPIPEDDYDDIYVYIPVSLGVEKEIPQFFKQKSNLYIYSQYKNTTVLINSWQYRGITLNSITPSFTQNTISCKELTLIDNVILDENIKISVSLLNANLMQIDKMMNMKTKKLFISNDYVNDIVTYNDTIVIDSYNIRVRNRNMKVFLETNELIVNLTCYSDLVGNIVFIDSSLVELHYYGNYTYKKKIYFNDFYTVKFFTENVPLNIIINSPSIFISHNITLETMEINDQILIKSDGVYDLRVKNLTLNGNGIVKCSKVTVYAENLNSKLNNTLFNSEINADNVLIGQSTNQAFYALHNDLSTPLDINISFTTANVPFAYIENSLYSKLNINVINDADDNDDQHFIDDYIKETDPAYMDFNVNLICMKRINCSKVSMKMIADLWFFDESTKKFELRCDEKCVSIVSYHKEPEYDSGAQSKEEDLTFIISVVTIPLGCVLALSLIAFLVYRKMKSDRIKSFVDKSCTNSELLESSETIDCVM